MHNPPQMVKVVIEAALTLLGFSDMESWTEMRKVLK
jgi:hypothetical protein